MRWLAITSMLFALTGCRAHYADVDGQIAHRAMQPVDIAPVLPPMKAEPKMLPSSSPPMQTKRAALRPSIPEFEAEQQEQPEKEKKAKGFLERLEFKEGILGIAVKDLTLPSFKAPQEERTKAIEKQFPPLPKTAPLPAAEMGPDGQPLTLADLQQIALRTNPLVRQAHQDIQAARGLALQAGLYPNPIVGWEASTAGQGNTSGNRSAGQEGPFAEGTVVTMRKLKIARDAAERDVRMAEQKLKQVETEVQTQVRTNYFAVLSARENHRVLKGLTDLTDELFNVLVLQMLAGEVAAYEPMQIRVLAMQSRGSLVQAHNRYIASWKQLAAALGTPTMPLTALAGTIEMPVPNLDQDQILAFVLANHSEVISARFGVDKANFLTRLAEVQPYPDILAHVAVQRDYTTPPYGIVANISVGVPVPLWNRNQGNIQATRSQLQRAIAEQARVHNELSGKVAEAFQRYENNRILLDMYKQQMLPNQVQAFRAAVARHAAGGDKNVSYNDIVTVQQSLANLIGSYLGVLNDQWASVVDIASLMQTSDLFQTQPLGETAPNVEMGEVVPPGLRHRR